MVTGISKLPPGLTVNSWMEDVISWLNVVSGAFMDDSEPSLCNSGERLLQDVAKITHSAIATSGVRFASHAEHSYARSNIASKNVGNIAQDYKTGSISADFSILRRAAIANRAALQLEDNVYLTN